MSSHALPADPDDDCVPATITVTGRNKERENQDLQGVYHRIKGLHHGRPAYRKVGATTCIRYWSPADRWLIDREGLQESDTCNAYAEKCGSPHPAQEDIVWCVWETSHRAHVRDPELLVTSAPPSLQVIGRQLGKENWALNGEYQLVGLRQGRVAYQKVNAQHAIRYWGLGDRWLIDFEGLRDVDVCNAYADARGASHPGTPELEWHVWDSARSKHVQDNCLQCIVAPAVVEVVGREAPKENVSMNGSYYLCGLHAGRPAYMKTDGSGHAIRYWPREDRWLLDLDGLRDADICNAYAEARGGHYHPGSLDIVWNVWETSRGKHLTDDCVRSLIAPHSVRVSGRDPQKENAALNGEYILHSIVEGKASYKKEKQNHVMRYWASEDRWIIDLEAGYSGGDIANAYADAKGAEDPGSTELIWHVWETSRGRHVIDEDAVSEGQWLPPPDWSKVPGFSRVMEADTATDAMRGGA